MSELLAGVFCLGVFAGWMMYYLFDRLYDYVGRIRKM
jgi:hypothetical protein